MTGSSGANRGVCLRAPRVTGAGGGPCRSGPSHCSYLCPFCREAWASGFLSTLGARDLFPGHFRGVFLPHSLRVPPRSFSPQLGARMFLRCHRPLHNARLNRRGPLLDAADGEGGVCFNLLCFAWLFPKILLALRIRWLPIRGLEPPRLEDNSIFTLTTEILTLGGKAQVHGQFGESAIPNLRVGGAKGAEVTHWFPDGACVVGGTINAPRCSRVNCTCSLSACPSGLCAICTSSWFCSGVFPCTPFFCPPLRGLQQRPLFLAIHRLNFFIQKSDLNIQEVMLGVSLVSLSFVFISVLCSKPIFGVQMRKLRGLGPCLRTHPVERPLPKDPVIKHVFRGPS